MLAGHLSKTATFCGPEDDRFHCSSKFFKGYGFRDINFYPWKFVAHLRFACLLFRNAMHYPSGLSDIKPDNEYTV